MNKLSKNKTPLLKRRGILYIIAFFLPVVLLAVAYAAFRIWPFGERSVLALDLNGQYVYYYEALKNAVFGKGSIFYSWSRNMSGQFFGLFSYYLASPFVIIPTVIPRAYITEAILIMQLAKVGACSVTFAYYLNKSNRSDKLSSVPFATLYALIGYNAVQLINPMWLDGVIYLPLIILGIERLIKEKKILTFAVFMGLMFLANFYIGYMVGIFSAIYFIIYLISEEFYKKPKQALDRIIRVGIGAIIALCIAAITLIPVYKALTMGKMEFSTPPTYDAYAKFKVATVLGKLLPFSYDSVNVEGLPFIYCGVITLLLAPLYFAAKNIPLRKKVCGMAALAVSFILMYISTFDLLMHGGQWPNWLNYRYSFIFSFLLLSMASKAFMNLDKIERASVFKVYGVLIGIIVFFNTNWLDYITDNTVYWFVVVALTLYLGVIIVIKLKPRVKKVCVICLTVFIGYELIFNAIDTFKKIDEEVLYSTRASYTDWYDEFSPVVENVKSNDNGFYRMDSTYHRTVNDPMALDIYGISHSSSLMNNNALNFLTAMGYTSRGFESKYFGGTIVGDSLIGMKYVIVEWTDIGSDIVPKTRLRVYDDLYEDIYDNGYVLHTYKNPYALPIAFYASKNLENTHFDLEDNNVFENQNQLINNILGTEGVSYFKQVQITKRTLSNLTENDAVDQLRYIPENPSLSSSLDYVLESDIDGELYMFIPTNYHRSTTVNFNGQEISEYFADDYHTALGLGKITAKAQNYLSLILNEEDLYMKAPYFYVLDEEAFAEAVEKIKENPSEVKMKNAANLEISLSAEDNGYMYTSIPYEKGWTVKIDGKKAEPVCLAGGLLAVPISKGEHRITMKFVPDGFRLGLTLTILGILAVILIANGKKLKELMKKSKKA